MKILMAARRYPPDVWSGTETVFQSLYERARRSHQVRLVVGWTRERQLVPSEAVAVKLKGLSKPAAWMAMSKAVLAEARRWKPDVVLSNSIEVPPTGVPTACIVHDLNFGQAAVDMETRLKAGFYALRGRGLGRIITVSQASAEALQRAGLPAERIRVVHNGVDTERFRPVPDEARGLDEKSDEKSIVHFVHPSRILPGKGQHHAIDAVARLPRLHKRRARLTVVGSVVDPIYLDQLKVQSFNQPVEFAVDVPDIVPYYQAADVVLFPTVMTEGFGFTAVEAMACGKPVIWFDQPAIREATGGIGVSVPREDVAAMRAPMMRLMDDPEERARIGREGRDFVVRERGWDQVWERYARILAEIRR